MAKRTIRKLLVANRGEIAIRVMRGANELRIRTVAIYANEDRLSLHRFKADEAYQVGHTLGPVKAYLSIEEMMRVAREVGCDAIHPGYGFLSENPDFADACVDAGVLFIGPPSRVMRTLGNKLSARALAERAGVPVMPATGPLRDDIGEIRTLAAAVGYPVMLKASWGGGGRGMRVIESEATLEAEVTSGRREAAASFDNDEVYLEKLVRRARHVEVQLLADTHGNLVHLYERDCTVQRRHQKVVERAPAPYLDDQQRQQLCDAALSIAREADYVNAGTVEFLMDADTDAFYFIEVNPRIQVEHTVTEQVTGIDIVKAQIRIAQGARIGDVAESGVPEQADIKLNGNALQCRITTEDPEANFIPDYGRITAYRGATGFGVRLDGGTAYSGAVITRYYDSLLEKVTTWAPTAEEAVIRMDRALREFRIRGVATNRAFVENLINHKCFAAGDYTTRFIDDTPELFHFPARRDRATKLLTFIADVIVNGNPAVAGRPKPANPSNPSPPAVAAGTAQRGTRDLLDELGPERFSQWMLDRSEVLVTDTAMRDAHQSLLATRMRSYDIWKVGRAYSQLLPELFSLECWGGATFDVSMRFLKECPWNRLRGLREQIPNILFQMLLRGANGVGYTNYPDNVIQSFVAQAANSGIDLFRVFDSLNWVENMRVSMDAVLESGKLLEGAICYTGDMLDPNRPKYDLDYYLTMARELKAAGCHIIGVKDMAGLCKPNAAELLIGCIKRETGLPVHFHTHDTSGISAASVLAAVHAGADAVDAACDALSGTTSQPNLGSIVEALRGTERDTGLDVRRVREISDYWERVRSNYTAFETDQRFGASEVYMHEMPGGQFTNLKEQARRLGLEGDWHKVASTYAEVNRMFGDIVKVTPTSKVVGDMALMMVSAGLTPEEVENPNREVAFPDSVVAFFRGEMGQPAGGFPKALSEKVLKGETPLTDRPGATLAPADLTTLREEADTIAARPVSDEEFNSFLMYPKVFSDYIAFARKYSAVDVLPTSTFFYGMTVGEEITVDIEPGKTLIISCQAVGETEEDGSVKVFFELNGQPRAAKVPFHAAADQLPERRRAEPGNDAHVAAPMPGMVASVAVTEGQRVSAGDVLLSIEAMKMETAIHAERDGVIQSIVTPHGTQVDAKDLLIELAPIGAASEP